ncbi:MAG: hypothetical protein ABEJ94_01795 [Halorientalis sp.]
MVSKFYVYETLHAGESESSHHDELTEWNIDPDLVGIEGDPQAARTDGLFTRSPGTSAVLALHTLITRFHVGSQFSPSDLGASIAAARRYARESGVPVVALDRRTHGDYVETLSRTRCVAETALALGVLVTMLALPTLLGSPAPSGLVGAVSNAVIDGVTAAIPAAFVFLPVFVVILWGYVKWLRRTRPTEMVETAVESCRAREADTALLVVAQRYTDDLRERTEARGVEVEVRSSPATRELDGDRPAVYRLKRTLRLT